jgi:hypothetical protein
MNRRRFAIAAAMAAALLIAQDNSGDQSAFARKRRRRGGGGSNAFASGSVTETGGHVSVAVDCDPGQSASATHGSQATVRC